jgi:NAD(P)H-hydrate epimerase
MLRPEPLSTTSRRAATQKGPLRLQDINRKHSHRRNFTASKAGNTKTWWICMTILSLSVRFLSRNSGRALAFIQSSSYRPTAAALSLILPTTTWSTSTSTSSNVDTALFSTQSTCDNINIMPTGYLNAADAAALDDELMSTPGYCLEQLMELAGLAVAEAVYQGIPPTVEKKRKILLTCGPGNNGGDGLVAARHLFFFNHYDCTIVSPKRSNKQHFVNLVHQCEDVGIPFLEEMPSMEELETYDAIVDSIFGFSFKGEPREPFATVMKQMIQAQQTYDNLKVISVDVPSGWNVDEGDVAKTGFVPDMLVSLTTPKMCSKEFTGRHFIGGRFLPPAVARKYNVQVRYYLWESWRIIATMTIAHDLLFYFSTDAAIPGN